MCHLFVCVRTMRHAAAEIARDNLREWKKVAPEKDGGAARRPPPMPMKPCEKPASAPTARNSGRVCSTNRDHSGRRSSDSAPTPPAPPPQPFASGATAAACAPTPIVAARLARRPSTNQDQ